MAQMADILTDRTDGQDVMQRCAGIPADAPRVKTAERLLFSDAIAAAYHLALLERPYSDHVLWRAHRSLAGEMDAAAAFYSLRRPTIIFLIGDALGVDACLASGKMPDTAYVAHFPQHCRAVCRHYEQVQPALMHRMILSRAAFRGGSALAATVLTRKDLPALEALYKHESGFRADMHQFDQGRYAGIYAGDSLVAAAGTHFVSPQTSIAMIGNVATHPEHRGCGYGRAVVLGLLRMLFEQVRCVCLNVRENNAPAVKLYQTLGFSTHCTYYESLCATRAKAANSLLRAV